MSLSASSGSAHTPVIPTQLEVNASSSFAPMSSSSSVSMVSTTPQSHSASSSVSDATVAQRRPVSQSTRSEALFSSTIVKQLLESEGISTDGLPDDWTPERPIYTYWIDIPDEVNEAGEKEKRKFINTVVWGRTLCDLIKTVDMEQKICPAKRVCYLFHGKNNRLFGIGMNFPEYKIAKEQLGLISSLRKGMSETEDYDLLGQVLKESTPFLTLFRSQLLPPKALFFLDGSDQAGFAEETCTQLEKKLWLHKNALGGDQIIPMGGYLDFGEAIMARLNGHNVTNGIRFLAEKKQHVDKLLKKYRDSSNQEKILQYIKGRLLDTYRSKWDSHVIENTPLDDLPMIAEEDKAYKKYLASLQYSDFIHNNQEAKEDGVMSLLPHLLSVFSDVSDLRKLEERCQQLDKKNSEWEKALKEAQKRKEQQLSWPSYFSRKAKSVAKGIYSATVILPLCGMATSYLVRTCRRKSQKANQLYLTVSHYSDEGIRLISRTAADYVQEADIPMVIGSLAGLYFLGPSLCLNMAISTQVYAWIKKMLTEGGEENIALVPREEEAHLKSARLVRVPVIANVLFSTVQSVVSKDPVPLVNAMMGWGGAELWLFMSNGIISANKLDQSHPELVRLMTCISCGVGYLCGKWASSKCIGLAQPLRVSETVQNSGCLLEEQCGEEWRPLSQNMTNTTVPEAASCSSNPFFLFKDELCRRSSDLPTDSSMVVYQCCPRAMNGANGVVDLANCHTQFVYRG